MNRYRALLQERQDLIGEAKALFASAEDEGRDLTPDEKGRDDEINARLEAVSGEIAREERRREWERTAPAVMPETMPAQVRQEPEKFASLGDNLLAIRAASVPGGHYDNRLQPYAAAPGMRVGSGADGGFLMQTDFVAGIWQHTYEASPLLAKTFKVPIGNLADSVKINAVDETTHASGSVWGGVIAYWVAEAGTITDTAPKFRQMELAPKELAVLFYATGQMLRNAAAVDAVANQAVPRAMAYQIEDALVNGLGAGKPLGWLNATCLISVTKETGQAADTIVKANIDKMWARMWAPSRANAVWLINQDAEPQLESLAAVVGVGGVPVYLPSGGIADTPYARLKGRPVMPVEYCQTVGDKGDIMLVDFSQYATADRGTVEAASSIHVQFLTNQSAFRFIYEIDGQPLWSSALTTANSAATLGPCIVLDARA